MSGGPSRPQRVRQAHVEWILDRLGPRDRAIVADMQRTRLLTSSQLERLHFAEIEGRSRSVVRARVLKRLTDWRVITPLPRRIGGTARGSAELVYAMDSTGQNLVRILTQSDAAHQRIRRPLMPGERFVRHLLSVSELYVQTVEADRSDVLHLVQFWAEPDAWLPDGLGSWLKPDAYLIVVRGDFEDSWAIEVDKATEHLPAIRRKLDTYADFMQRGQRAANGVMPRVLITTPNEHRQAVITEVVARLPEPADSLFRVVTEDRAIATVTEVLRE